MKTSMYDHRQNVFEIQSALRALWNIHAIATLINPDGSFGSETARAVEEAQRYFGLPPTGIVDLETWQLLFSTCMASDQSFISCGLFPNP